MAASTKRFLWIAVGLLVLVVLVLYGDAARRPFGLKPHTVLLTWQASTSEVDGYNVYRRVLPNGSFVKVNGDNLVEGRTFVDALVRPGVKYQYTVRASAHGRESVDSRPVEADVP